MTTTLSTPSIRIHAQDIADVQHLILRLQCDEEYLENNDWKSPQIVYLRSAIEALEDVLDYAHAINNIKGA